jgi:two-component system, cell cycle sensor histidine kinase and response regulator CckA
VVPAGRYVALTMKDTGVGMSAETQANIFEPFFTTKPPEMGTGLGLAMVHGIVSQSGGYITVESELGTGTNFTVYFPHVQSEEVNPEITPRHLQEQAERGSETLLLVEDAMALRTMIGEYLRSLGYTVLTAANGVEALVLAREYQEPIHLLITDVVMPLLGGVELQKEMQALRPGIPVLFMTGYADETLEQRQGSTGVVLIQKPFRMNKLAYTLHEIFNGTRNVPTDAA